VHRFVRRIPHLPLGLLIRRSLKHFEIVAWGKDREIYVS
jgi:hypothetical protein